MADGDTMDYGRRVARIHHRPLRRDGRHWPVAAGIGSEGIVAKRHARGHDGVHDRTVRAGERRVSWPLHLCRTAREIDCDTVALDDQLHMQRDRYVQVDAVIVEVIGELVGSVGHLCDCCAHGCFRHIQYPAARLDHARRAVALRQPPKRLGANFQRSDLAL